jgi:hypothetical protein
MAFAMAIRSKHQLLAQLETFLDSILVRSAESTDNKRSSIRCSRVDWNLVANFNHVDDPIEIREIDIGMNALSIKIQSQGNKINISSSLAITKKTSFDSIRTSDLCQFCCRNRAATVVMWVKRNTNLLPLSNISAEVLNLIRINVRRRHLDRSREIEDNWVLDSRPPSLLHSLANLDHKLRPRI